MGGMRIVHLIARLNDGGPARVIAALAQAHAAMGCTVEIWAGACADDEPDLAPALGVPVTRIAGLGRAVRPGDDLRAVIRLARRLHQDPPDLLHTHTAKAGAIGRVLARLWRIPCLHTYHGHVLHGYWPRAVHAALACCERACAGNAWHQALTPSQLIELRDRHGIGRANRWGWLPVPVRPVAPCAAAWHAHLPPGQRILFLGRCVPVKDPLLWVESLARLEGACGILCGDGPLRQMALDRAATLGVRLVAPGFVPAAEALAVADALLLTSRNEGLPLAAIEAAGVGVPVVAPAVGGLADLARWGVVRAADRTPAALAQALRETRGRGQPHPWAAALTPARLAPRYLAWYQRIVAEAG
jgi:glycosyltransferase involved in cell wall biosynthesis